MDYLASLVREPRLMAVHWILILVYLVGALGTAVGSVDGYQRRCGGHPYPPGVILNAAFWPLVIPFIAAADAPMFRCDDMG